MNAIIIIYCCGVFSLGFAVFHTFFWKIFDWKNDLRNNSIANRAIIQIANLCLIYLFLFIAFVCFAFANELLNTKLGNAFLIGISIFWFLRTVEQFIFLPYNHRLIHLLTFLFVLGTVLFALPVFLR
jgi:hypothetical protein